MEMSNCMNELIQIWEQLMKEEKERLPPTTDAFLNIAWQMNLKDLHYLIKSSHPGFLEVYHALYIK